MKLIKLKSYQTKVIIMTSLKYKQLSQKYLLKTSYLLIPKYSLFQSRMYKQVCNTNCILNIYTLL